MPPTLANLTGNQALVMGLAIVGSATAAVITKAISAGDYLTIIAGTGVVGGTVATAHVVGTQVNKAAGTPTGDTDKTEGGTPT
jgi:hypothetical protein